MGAGAVALEAPWLGGLDWRNLCCILEPQLALPSHCHQCIALPGAAGKPWEKHADMRG